MDLIRKHDYVDIELDSGNIHRSWMTHSIGKNDALANAFGVRVFRGGFPADLEGAVCEGFFRNAEGTNILITETAGIEGNIAYVALPQACYNVEGQFCLAIKLIGGGVTGTMRIVDGMVDNTNTSSPVAPTETVPTYQEILAVYAEMQEAVDDYDDVVAAQDAKIDDLKSAITFLSTKDADNTATWESGSLAAADASNITSQTRIRMAASVQITDNIIGLKAKTGYEFLVYAWTLPNTYIGCMKTGGSFDKTTSGYLWITEFQMKEGYKYKIVMRNATNPTANMTTAEGSNCLYVVRRIDSTLTQEQEAADAKVTGNMINLSMIGNEAINISGGLLLVGTIGSSNKNVRSGYRYMSRQIIIDKNYKAITVKAQTSKDAFITFFKTALTESLADDASVTPYLATGETGRHVIIQGNTETFAIPSDAVAIIVTVTSSDSDFTPDSMLGNTNVEKQIIDITEELDEAEEDIYITTKNLQRITGSKILEFVPGIYPTGSTGATIDISTPQTSQYGKYCAKTQVSEGQRLLLKTSSGSSSYKAYSVTDENFNVIKVAGSTGEYDTEIEIPADAAWVVVNSDPGSQYYAIIIDKADDSEMESVNQKIEAATGGRFLDFASGLFPTPAEGQQGSTTRSPSTNRISAITEIEEGETIKLNTSTGSSTYHTFAILDEDEIVLVQGDKNSGTKEFIAPEGSKYLVVNTIATYTNYYAIVFHSQDNLIYDSLNVGMFNRIAVCGTSWDCSYGYSRYTGELHAYTRRSRSWIAVLANMYGIDYSCYGVPSATTIAAESSHIGEHGAVCWQTDSHGLPKVLSDADNGMKSDLYWMDLSQNDWKKIGRYDNTYLGTIDDIKEDYTQNPDTFYGNYGRIVDQIIAKCPRALLIFSYKETASTQQAGKDYAAAVRAIAGHYGAPYINFEDDPWFLNWLEKHLVQDHPTFTDYAGIAKAAERLFAICAKKNWEYFKNFVPASDPS